MIRNHIISAFKYLKSSARFTLLNVAGLALGLSLTIMMVMLIHYELSFDNFHPQRDRIIQVVQHDLKSGNFSTSCPLPLPSTIISEFPEVLHATGIWKMIYPGNAFMWNDREFSGFTGASVDTGIFSIFRYELLAGNPDHLLEDPGQIAVSQHFSRTVFGQEDPLGQVVSIRGIPLTVTGVFRDIPDNSAVKYDVLFSEKALNFIRTDYREAWWNGGMKVYAILQPGAGLPAFQKHLEEVPETHYPDFLKGRSTFTTRPFRGSHFDTSVNDHDPPPVPFSYLLILASISVVTLLIAGINYINLSTAQSAGRNIDSGIRRIFGARSGQVVGLHLWISFLSVVSALALALVITSLAMPLTGKLTQRPLSSQYGSIGIWFVMAAIILLMVFITGIIPGTSFTRAEPAEMIRTRGRTRISRVPYRNGMVVFQFVLTITLIISQLFIYKQVRFMKNTDLGYDNDNLVALDLDLPDDGHRDPYDMARLFRDEAERSRQAYGFSKGTITEDVPGYYYENSFLLVPADALLDELLVISTAVDENFTEVYRTHMAEGRYFSWDYATDSTAFIINETAMKKLGWKSTDGKYLKFRHEGQSFPVVGVMKDIHPGSLRKPIAPMVYRFGAHNNFPSFITFRIDPEKKTESIAFLEKTWNSLFPAQPFSWFDVKKKYYANYTEENRFAGIVGSFTLMAILLSALGLFGLVSFLAERKQKEIGIRKANGAGTREIMLMMSGLFLRWIALAFLFACPVAWMIMHRWLQDFAYRTSLSPWVFLLAGFLSLSIAWITVSWQSWKAASRSPVRSLRYE